MKGLFATTGLFGAPDSGGGGGGSVESVSVASANGFNGSVANPTDNAIITLTTTVTGILYGNGTAVAAAVAGNFPTLNQNTSGLAGSATKLATARAINGVNFDGTAAITITSAAGTLTGTTLNATVVSSSLTSVGTIATGVWQGTLIGPTYGGTGINNGSSTITIGGNLTLSGAHTTAITIANNTVITFPTSGTILSTSQAATLVNGFYLTPYSAGTFSSGTYTPDAGNGNMQYATNNGAHTLAPPSANCVINVEYTNGAAAGAITTSGFTKVTGDSFTTTNANKFICNIIKQQNTSLLQVVAMQ